MASANDSKWQKDAADQNFDYMFKLLIIGNSSVGKTSFLFRYADDSFTSAFVSTVGIDFKVKTVFRQDKRVKLQIWAISWMFNFIHLHKYDNGYLVCYDDWGEWLLTKVVLDGGEYFYDVFYSKCSSTKHLVSLKKRKKIEWNSQSFALAKLKQTPVRWPVEIRGTVEGNHQLLQVYIKSDNALLTVKSCDVFSLAGNVSAIRKEGLDVLKRKKLLWTASAYLSDFDWVLQKSSAAQNENTFKEVQIGEPMSARNENTLPEVRIRPSLVAREESTSPEVQTGQSLVAREESTSPEVPTGQSLVAQEENTSPEVQTGHSLVAQNKNTVNTSPEVQIGQSLVAQNENTSPEVQTGQTLVAQNENTFPEVQIGEPMSARNENTSPEVQIGQSLVAQNENTSPEVQIRPSLVAQEENTSPEVQTGQSLVARNENTSPEVQFGEPLSARNENTSPEVQIRPSFVAQEENTPQEVQTGQSLVARNENISEVQIVEPVSARTENTSPEVLIRQSLVAQEENTFPEVQTGQSLVARNESTSEEVQIEEPMSARNENTSLEVQTGQSLVAQEESTSPEVQTGQSLVAWKENTLPEVQIGQLLCAQNKNTLPDSPEIQIGQSFGAKIENTSPEAQKEQPSYAQNENTASEVQVRQSLVAWNESISPQVQIKQALGAGNENILLEVQVGEPMSAWNENTSPDVQPEQSCAMNENTSPEVQIGHSLGAGNRNSSSEVQIEFKQTYTGQSLGEETENLLEAEHGNASLEVETDTFFRVENEITLPEFQTRQFMGAENNRLDNKESKSDLNNNNSDLRETFFATKLLDDCSEHEIEDSGSEYCPDDSDFVEESDVEDEHHETEVLPCKQVHDTKRYFIKEKYIIRDITTPGIYIRRVRKSSKASKPQLKNKKVGNVRVYDNYQYCLYCDEMRQHIKTHMKTHRTKQEVKDILKDENPDFTQLRKLGNHKNNKNVVREGIGEIILARRPSVLDITQYGPCTHCKKWMLLKNIKRHLAKCTKKKVTFTKRQIIIMSQVEAGVISSNPSKLMLEEVFPSMRMDEVGNLAKEDHLIVALGESWLRRTIDNREKRRNYASQHMRLMAKLLIEMRHMDTCNSEKGFEYFLDPRQFERMLAGALECCFPYLDDLEDLKSPSNGIKLKYDLRRMVTAKWALLVKKDPHSEVAKEMQTLQELITVEWGERITKLARSVMVRRQFTIRKELPAPEDVERLTVYMISELKSVPLIPENFARITQLTQTRLMMFNRRRSGEIDAIRLSSYAGKTRSLDEIDQSMIGELTDVERHLLHSHDLMKVRGKYHRPVPVLIPRESRKPLDYLSSRAGRRAAGISDTNDYLFANTGSANARAYSSLKKVCSECTLVAPTRITSVSIRKYTATLTQVINMDKYQLDWLCEHLGHTGDVHKAHYRQMSGMIERVKMTKLFMIQDMNLTQKFRDKKLDEIDITDIVFPNGDKDSLELEDFDDDTLVNTVVADLPQNERDEEPAEELVFEDEDSDDEEEMEEEIVEQDLARKKKAKPKFVRQRWDEIETEEIMKYFKSFLDAGITPRSKEVESAKRKSQKMGGKLWKRSNDKIIKKISAMNHKK